MRFAFWRLFPDPRAGARGPEEWGQDETRGLARPGWVEPWAIPPQITIPPLPDHDWADYLEPSLLPSLCSPRMRTLVEDRLGADDVVQWLPVQVADRHGERRDYWLLRPYVLETDTILDAERTVYSPGGLMKAVLDARRLAGRHLIRYPYERTSGVIVSEPLRRAIADAGLTGCQFTPAPATHIDDTDLPTSTWQPPPEG